MPADIVVTENIAVNNNQVAEPVALSATSNSAVSYASVEIPAGAAVSEGTSALTLKVSENPNPNPNVTVSAGKKLLPLLISVDGIAEGNNELLSVELSIDKGLTNLEIYHDQVKMTEVVGNTPGENTYTYNEDTGLLVLYVKDFSPFNIFYRDDGVVEVATVEELQEVLNNTKKDKVSVLLTKDIAGDATVNQPANKDISVVIDGQGHKYNGQIKIVGNSANAGADSLLIKNVNFETATADQVFIWSYDQNAPTRYAHNVTISNCTFTANGAAANTAVGLKFLQAYNITVTNCTATNMHSLMQAESCKTTVTVDNCKIVNSKNGVSFNNTENAVIKNTEIEAVGAGSYGVRHKGEQNNYSLTVESCNIKAFVPVLIRNMTGVGYKATISGNTTLTQNNAFGYQIVLTAGDWDSNEAPSAPTGSYELGGTANFSVFGKK